MSAVRKRLYYIWKKLSEREARKKQATKFFKNDIARFNAATYKKPTNLIRSEMKALQQYWRCYPFQYYRHDFYLQDCPLTLEQMKQYVPLFYLHNLFFPAIYKDYGVLCEDKLLTYAILNAYDLPQPKLPFCFDHKTFFDSTNMPVSAEQVNLLIRSCTAAKLFVKPRFGSEGKGIVVFERNGDQYISAEKQVLNHTFFLNEAVAKSISGRDQSGFYVVQEGVTQHEELNTIYPNAVNTFRIITECIDANVRIMYALLRIGCGGNQVDNASSGGIYLKIDPETGILGDYAIAFDRQTFAVHPDTNFVFKGATLHTWNSAKAFIQEVAVKFREVKYLGWDVAMTIEGPVLIEINNRPDMAMIQDFYGGIRDDFKINPDDWWFQSNYTIKNI